MLMLLQFQPIPDECRITENLFKYIHPSDGIVWWQAENIDFEKNKAEILFCSDTTLRPEKQIFLMKNTFPCFYHDFLIGPTHEFCLIYRTDSVKKYITKKEELKDFIGTVYVHGSSRLSGASPADDPGLPAVNSLRCVGHPRVAVLTDAELAGSRAAAAPVAVR